uniref:Uncharacterized protein n=1 Tax=Anguilla anguilla TaxID=7936 RepID=A0A0E9QDH7_ANGAN
MQELLCNTSQPIPKIRNVIRCYFMFQILNKNT